MIKMTKKDEIVKLKNYARKIKSPFLIYDEFQSTLIPKNNGNQNSDDSYGNNYQNHVGCSFGYEIVCVDDQLSKSKFSLSHTKVKMLFIILSLMLLKKVNILVA